MSRPRDPNSHRGAAERLSSELGFHVTMGMVRYWMSRGYPIDDLPSLKVAISNQERLPNRVGCKLISIRLNSVELCLYHQLWMNDIRDSYRKNPDWSKHPELRAWQRARKRILMEDLPKRKRAIRLNSVELILYHREWMKDIRDSYRRNPDWSKHSELQAWQEARKRILHNSSKRAWKKRNREKARDINRKSARKSIRKTREQRDAADMLRMMQAAKEISELKPKPTKEND